MFDSQDTPETDALAAPAPEAKTNGNRKALFAGLGAVVLLGAAGYGAYYALVGSHHVETDNAYVGAYVAQVTPLVGGPVRSVAVNDTQAVKQGQVLVVLDDTDARIALASAQADLATAQRKVRGYLATDQSLSAQIAARDADQVRAAATLASARSDLDRTRVDLDRRKALAATGAVSGDELTRAQNAYANAQAAYDSAKAAQVQAAANRAAAVGSLAANTVLTDGTSVDTNPEVAAARARVDQASVDLARTVIRAPIDGVVTRRNVQAGQRVAAGAVLMQVVPVQQAYVDANFKEGQLRKVRIGQPVELEADLYGGSVKYHGTVTGLSGGTGSAFALIPAQNATGNWIKVVQRLPVRVAIDPADLKAHPLRVGLSMKATIDTAS
ncbi:MULTISPECIES: HlyD family efflux transporter periplasmic adaptor subunit [Caulobacter]|jgi:membrane fusion protein (multidrug efflux system)|uniref:Membrane fusion protein (Multidrug efflux system) n=1 Tax=Caulobacter rhizosphaerae TaxID=2010972 RepID=A0ABU1N476_9CAUL|nr:MULTISPECIES: HlyD family efflux transporter periplasmic adaptor subunit [Caulobacter]MDR6532875.1 membrane fusion protein (multidrug efflux system) [Caulobacter rhizosphaerae]GGL16158.1 hemolysin D [Caulobacter rhizosphaerae]